MTTTGQREFFPSIEGGKYHLATAVVGTARCRGTVLLDTSTSPIVVRPEQERVHPIVCRRCLAI